MWSRLRNQYIRKHPICELCQQRAAEVVHHKTRLREGGDRLNPDNLQSLCKLCHNQHHSSQGKGNLITTVAIAERDDDAPGVY